MSDTPNTSLVPVEQRAVLALNSTETEKHLRELAIKHADITAIKNKAGRDQAHGAAMELKNARVLIEKTSKEARDDATKFSKAVITEEKRLIAIIEQEEDRLFKVRDAWDAEQERIKAEKAALEKARVELIQTAITVIREIPLGLANATAAQILDAGRELHRMEITAEIYQEFKPAAEAEKTKALETLAGMLEAAKQREEEAARLEAQRIENERVAAENARIAAELAAQQAAIKAEAERVAIAAQAEAQKAIDEANAKSRREAEERAEMLKKQEDAFAAEKAEAQAKLDEQQAKLNAEVAAIAKANAEREAAEAAAKAAKELEEANARLKAQEEAKALRLAEVRERTDAIVDAIASQFQIDRSQAIEFLLEAAEFVREEEYA